MLTHATFLKNEYINDFKPRSKLLLEEISGKSPSNDSTRVVESTEEMSIKIWKQLLGEFFPTYG